MVGNDLLGDKLLDEVQCRGRYLGIHLVANAGHDSGLVGHVLAHQGVVEVGYAFIDNQVGNGCHLDIYQLHVAAVLRQGGVELERLEPFVYHRALLCHVAAVVLASQLQGEGAVAAKGLDVGLAVFLRVDHPVLLLRASLASYGIEERGSRLFVDRVA